MQLAAEQALIEAGELVWVLAVDDDRPKLADHGLGVAVSAAAQTIPSTLRLWDHLRMNREDDPEARIRELERPLNDQAHTSELGREHSGSNTAYLPPPVPGYTQPDYSTPVYGSPPPYGTQQYGAGYSAPPRNVSGGIPWLVFGMIAVVVLAIAGGVILFVSNMSSDRSTVSGGGGSIDIPSIPSIEIPSIPAPPGAPDADPTAIVGTPGETVTVSGIDSNRTIACNDGSVTISGIRNTVNITGHCVDVSVSGMNNVVTVDIADVIGVSGFDNRVTYHSGSPQIDASDSNVVEQG